MPFNDNEIPTGESWDDLYKSGIGAPKFPNGNVVRWLFGNFPRSKAASTKMLDMGTGMGRHTMLMAQEGYDVTGTDYSATCIEQAKNWAEAEGLDISFKQASAESQPFPDQSFDGIICYAVLYYLPLDKFILAIKEMHRLLRTGGSAFIMVKNDRDVRKSKGEEVAPYHYKITKNEEDMPWNNEVGMGLTLLPKSEILNHFSAFADIRIEEMTTTLGGGEFLESAWLIYVRK